MRTDVWTGRVYATDLDQFRQKFGRTSFALNHKLAHHSLFTPERLALAAERALASGRSDRFVVAGSAGAPSASFNDMAEQPKLAEAIAHIGAGQSWIKLSTIHTYDADYADLLSDALADVRDMAGDPTLPISYAQLTVFMASPHVVTPFHIDHESNFLSQITGEKKLVCVFPPDDRDVLTLQEIESFYMRDISSAQYKPQLQERGVEYALKPGATVHHPPLAPHWVKNGDDVSISLSLNFCMPPLERRARVYQVNYYLRQLGFKPPEPHAGLPDDLKSGALAAISKRHPQTYRDVVFSGIDRARLPARAAARAMTLLLAGWHALQHLLGFATQI